LVLGSRKPEAKKFKRWISHEVIPSIRRTGSYAVAAPVNEPVDHEIAIVQHMLDLLKDSRRQIAKLESNVTTHGGQISTLDSHVAVLEHRVDLFGADTNYRTVRAYCNQHKIKIPERRANAIGRKAAALCRARQVEIGNVADERHGSVHSYPIEIIAEAVTLTEAK
jgi:hypothetical protein